MIKKILNIKNFGVETTMTEDEFKKYHLQKMKRKNF